MLDTIKAAWNLIKRNVMETGVVSEISNITWIKPLEVVDSEGDNLLIAVPYDLRLAKTYISDHYSVIFEEVLREFYGQIVYVQFVASDIEKAGGEQL